MHLNINFFLLLFIHSFISFFKIILTLFNIIICNLICNLVLTCIHLLTTLPWVRECCEIDNIFEKGFLFLLLCLSGWEGCLSSVSGQCKKPCHKNGKPINEDKRQKTWGLDLETSSELELDGG